MTLTYLIRRPPGAEIEPFAETGNDELNDLIRQKLRTLMNTRTFLTRGGTLAFPCSHLYHQDARFQRKQKLLTRQSVTSLKGRDYAVAAAARANTAPPATSETKVAILTYTSMGRCT